MDVFLTTQQELHYAVPEQVLQELYGKLILFHFCKTLPHELLIPQKRIRIYQYQFNMVMTLDTYRQFWRSCGETAPEEIEILLQKYLVPIREDRSCPRQPVSRKKKRAGENLRLILIQKLGTKTGKYLR